MTSRLRRLRIGVSLAFVVIVLGGLAYVVTSPPPEQVLDVSPPSNTPVVSPTPALVLVGDENGVSQRFLIARGPYRLAFYNDTPNAACRLELDLVTEIDGPVVLAGPQVFVRANGMFVDWFRWPNIPAGAYFLARDGSQPGGCLGQWKGTLTPD